MTNMITINLRTFPVQVRDNRTGVVKETTVYITKEQLRAAQIVGQSSKELIERLCNLQGYAVLNIGKPGKPSIVLDLEELVKGYIRHSMGQGQPDGPHEARGGDTD